MKKSRNQKATVRTRGAAMPKPNAPLVHLASGPVSPIDAASTARAAKAAFESGLQITNLTKIAAVIEGKAMNGDLQAARMLMDYYGMTSPPHEEESEAATHPAHMVQVNIERGGRKQQMKLVEAKSA